jgi:hypothetical protein
LSVATVAISICSIEREFAKKRGRKSQKGEAEDIGIAVEDIVVGLTIVVRLSLSHQ